jgi:hypothetical protein
MGVLRYIGRPDESAMAAARRTPCTGASLCSSSFSFSSMAFRATAREPHAGVTTLHVHDVIVGVWSHGAPRTRHRHQQLGWMCQRADVLCVGILYGRGSIRREKNPKRQKDRGNVQSLRRQWHIALWWIM